MQKHLVGIVNTWRVWFIKSKIIKFEFRACRERTTEYDLNFDCSNRICSGKLRFYFSHKTHTADLKTKKKQLNSEGSAQYDFENIFQVCCVNTQDPALVLFPANELISLCRYSMQTEQNSTNKNMFYRFIFKRKQFRRHFMNADDPN